MARKFRFPLETLLKVRQMRQREAERSVGRTRADIARLDLLDEQTRDEISRQQTALLDGQQQHALDPLELQRGRAWVAHLRRTIAMRHTQRLDLRQELQQRLSELRDARQQARIIERLREKRWEEYRRDNQRREQSESDELARQLQFFEQVQ